MAEDAPIMHPDAAEYRYEPGTRPPVPHPNLQGYLQELYQIPGIAQTVNFDHIKRHYYMTHDQINPNRIVPKGPLVDWTTSHHRERLDA